MSNYSIKDLEQLSGIKAHTIRIWEKRYKIIEPQRTKTNIRYYTDQDLKKILNVSILNNKGYKISRIANFQSDDLRKKVYELSQLATDYPVQIDRLIMAMVELDERLFNDIVSSLTLKIGFEETVLNILYPFLEKIGILWITGNIHPAQEHFITNLIRQKLIVVIDALPVPEKASRNFLLFLRDGEFHELSMLFMNYILRVNGFYTYYLGQTVPLEDVIKVCEKHKPEFIATSFITSSLQEKPKDFLLKLSEAVPDTMIIAGGRQLCEDDQKSLPANCTFAKDSTDFKQIIGKL
jgi:DNA-binding transcriptional MerR regulator